MNMTTTSQTQTPKTVAAQTHGGQLLLVYLPTTKKLLGSEEQWQMEA